MSEKLPFDGILLISDMDKTLVTEKFEVPPRNIEAINRFIGQGGHFALATGRSAASARKYLDRVNISAPCILSNGATIYDFETREILWKSALPDSAAALLQKVIDRFPTTGAEVYRDEKIYIVNENPTTKRHIIDEGFDFIKCGVSDVEPGWQKILFADTNDVLQKVDAFVREQGHDGCDLVFSNTVYYEVLPAGISKGTALSILAEMVGVKMENTVGIGDYYNDRTLVQMAGLGAVVAGAPQELKELAQFVSGPCENGAVADLIEYLEKKV